MRKAAILSAILHLIIFLFIILQFRFLYDKQPALPPITIEFAKIGPERKAPQLAPEANDEMAKPKPEKKTPEPEKKEEPKTQPEKAEPKEEPVQKEEEKPKEIKKEEPKKEEKKPEPPKKIDPLKDKKSEKKKEEQKKPEEKKKPEDKKKKKTDGLVNLNDKKPSKKTDKNEKTKKTLNDILDEITPKEGENKPVGMPASSIGNEITITELDALIGQLKKCWYVDKGMKDWKDQSVEIHVKINAMGIVEKAEIVDQTRLRSDPLWRTAAEKALRASLDPECQPLPLPADKYTQWKDMIINFDPKDM